MSEIKDTGIGAKKLVSVCDFVCNEYDAAEKAYREGEIGKTGFPELDREIGAMHVGLYVLAGMPATGKTTFALQLAEQVAMGGFDMMGAGPNEKPSGGRDVLFFSLEMSTYALINKGLARRTYKAKPADALTARRIADGASCQSLQPSKSLMQAELTHLYINECTMNLTVTNVMETVRAFRNETAADGNKPHANSKPLVVIDYLQQLQPTPDPMGKPYNGDRRAAIDSIVTDLKRFAETEKVCILCLSSTNREGYETGFGFKSLKESGGIEFTADVIWGLQLACIGKGKTKPEEIAEAKKDPLRELQLVCVKNRFGGDFTIPLYYLPAFDAFSGKEANFSHTADAMKKAKKAEEALKAEQGIKYDENGEAYVQVRKKRK